MDPPERRCSKGEAGKMAGLAVCDEGPALWGQREWSMSVTDARGMILFYILILA